MKFNFKKSFLDPLQMNRSRRHDKTAAEKLELLDRYKTFTFMSQREAADRLGISRGCFNQSINQFSGPAYPWGVAGAAAQVGASKHLDPLQQRIDALLGCQGETN